jgi:hypothetical protein
VSLYIAALNIPKDRAGTCLFPEISKTATVHLPGARFQKYVRHATLRTLATLPDAWGARACAVPGPLAATAQDLRVRTRLSVLFLDREPELPGLRFPRNVRELSRHLGLALLTLSSGKLEFSSIFVLHSCATEYHSAALSVNLLLLDLFQIYDALYHSVTSLARLRTLITLPDRLSFYSVNNMGSNKLSTL